jgi:hypothetical protein
MKFLATDKSGLIPDKSLFCFAGDLTGEALSTPFGRESICPVTVDRANRKAISHRPAFVRIGRAKRAAKKGSLIGIRPLRETNE